MIGAAVPPPGQMSAAMTRSVPRMRCAGSVTEVAVVATPASPPATSSSADQGPSASPGKNPLITYYVALYLRSLWDD